MLRRQQQGDRRTDHRLFSLELITLTLYSGTSEIQRNIIAREGCGFDLSAPRSRLPSSVEGQSYRTAQGDGRKTTEDLKTLTFLSLHADERSPEITKSILCRDNCTGSNAYFRSIIAKALGHSGAERTLGIVVARQIALRL